MQDSEDLITYFKAFGFSLYESKAYITLVKYGILSAPSIAKHSTVPKSKVYETLENLLKKRVIEEFPGSPKKFRPRSPAFVFKELISQKKEDLKQIETSAGILKTKLEMMINNTEKTYISNDSLLWTVNGRRAFHEKFAEIGARATKEIKVMTPYFSRNSILENAIDHAKSRGVIFTGITSVNDSNKNRVKFYLEYFNKIFAFNGNIPMTIIIIDNKECIYRIDHKINNNSSYIGVYSTSKNLIEAFIQYWNGLMKNSSQIRSL